MATLTLTDFTGALEGVADTDYRLVEAGARASSPWNVHAVDANTVALWRMDEASWSGAVGEVIDASGNARHGQALGGASTVESVLNRAGQFVRTSNHGVFVPHNSALNITGDMCMECWFYRSAAWTSNWEHLFNKRASGGTVAPYGCNMKTGVIQWFFGDGTLRICSHTVPPTLNAWTHLAFTRASGILKIWYNGVEVKSADFSTRTPGTNTEGMRIAQATASAEPITALIDDMRLSNVARYSSTFTPTMMSSASLRTAATVVDSGSAGSTWSQLVTTVAAVTGDETYAVYIYPSESATVPAASSGDWQLVGSGYTTGQTLSISGTGRYCHTKIVVGASTGIGQYAVELDGLEWTYTPAATNRIIIPVLQSGIARYL